MNVRCRKFAAQWTIFFRCLYFPNWDVLELELRGAGAIGGTSCDIVLERAVLVGLATTTVS